MGHEAPTVFITGATGVLGRALVQELLKTPECRLHLLLRAPDPQRFGKRCARLNERLGHDDERVTYWNGDVTRDRFGLSAEGWRCIATSCTHYVHAAGEVKLNLSFEEAQDTAVNSVATFIGLLEQGLAAGVARKAVCVSTVGVAGCTQRVVEERLYAPNIAFHNTYEQAKNAAEQLLMAKIQQGLPVELLRPSMIVGDSLTGAVSSFQVFYHLADILSGRKTGGLLPEIGPLQLDIIPIDVVVEAICHRLLRARDHIPIMHLASGPDASPEVAKLADSIREIYSELGVEVPGSVKLMDRNRFVNELPRLSMRYPRYRTAIIGLHYILPYFRDRQSFANDLLLTDLQARGRTLPRADTYLEPLLTYYVRSEKFHDAD